ncbi:hypothetical protein Dimus_019771 [Dionaea muscipula]
MKTVSRNKLMLCFRQVDIDSDAVDCSADSVRCRTSAVKRDRDPKISSPLSENTSSPPRSFPATIKSGWFHSSLRRSFRGRKSRKRPERSYSKVSDHQPELFVGKQSEIIAGVTQLVSLAGFPQPTSSTSKEKSADDLGGEHLRGRWAVTNTGGTNCLGSNYFVYLVVFSLWVTMFCGRLSAVTMTTIWLYAAQLIWRRNLEREREVQPWRGITRSRYHDEEEGGGEEEEKLQRWSLRAWN